jgi:hypothetical protein
MALIGTNLLQLAAAFLHFMIISCSNIYYCV